MLHWNTEEAGHASSLLMFIVSSRSLPSVFCYYLSTLKVFTKSGEWIFQFLDLLFHCLLWVVSLRVPSVAHRLGWSKMVYPLNWPIPHHRVSWLTALHMISVCTDNLLYICWCCQDCYLFAHNCFCMWRKDVLIILTRKPLTLHIPIKKPLTVLWNLTGCTWFYFAILLHCADVINHCFVTP